MCGLNVGLIYGFKGLILVFGLFLAYETRSIKVKQINDSRYVGMSIYNVVVLCLITAPVAMVIASQQDASFVFMALAVIFCCFLSMLLIFVPKVCIFPVISMLSYVYVCTVYIVAIVAAVATWPHLHFSQLCGPFSLKESSFCGPFNL